MTTNTAAATIRAIAARLTWDDEGVRSSFQGLAATAYCADNGIVRVAPMGHGRTLVVVSRWGAETVRTFVGTAGVEDYIRDALAD